MYVFGVDYFKAKKCVFYTSIFEYVYEYLSFLLL